MRRSGWVPVLPLLFLAAACQPAATPTVAATATTAPAIRTPPPPATPVPTRRVVAEQPGAELSQFEGRFFSASGRCTPCHQLMVDDAGNDVSIASHWRASMMANSARDPYWQAAVAQELELQPEQSQEIEALCARCHAPMASFTDRALGEQPAITGNGYLEPGNERHELAMDGVSCTLCHQIREDGLGLPESYGGGYQIDTELAPGRRVVFGPYTVEEQQGQIMEDASGFVPTQGLHQASSELCATCHTFFLPDSEFPLQTTYLEWYYSDYRATDSCQDCHMPDAEGGVHIADTSPFPRSPFAQHTLDGGNAYMLALLSENVSDLELTASAAQFEAARQRALDLLANQSISLELETAHLSGSRLTVDVALENLSGHKFPTGFPARRAWIHFWVEDAQGQIVFESGGYEPDGSIRGDDRLEDPAGYERHYQAIVQPEQVQVYETVLGGSSGNPTTSLMGAVRFLKDNRLPAAGYQPLRSVESIRVRGLALEDPDFIDGRDRIQYSMDLGNAQGPFRVGVEVLYQSIASGWLADMAGLDQQTVQRFLDLVDQLPNTPALAAQEIVSVGD